MISGVSLINGQQALLTERLTRLGATIVSVFEAFHLPHALIATSCRGARYTARPYLLQPKKHQEGLYLPMFATAFVFPHSLLFATRLSTYHCATERREI